MDYTRSNYLVSIRLCYIFFCSLLHPWPGGILLLIVILKRVPYIIIFQPLLFQIFHHITQHLLIFITTLTISIIVFLIILYRSQILLTYRINYKL